MNLKSALETVGMTQAELAKVSGVSARQVNAIVNGKSSIGNVTGKNLVLFASALGVSVEELLDDDTPDVVSTITAKRVLTKDALESLSPDETRAIVKAEQAKEWSGWRMYPTTVDKLMNRIPPEWWNTYSAKHIGEVMRLLKEAYDDGKRKEN